MDIKRYTMLMALLFSLFVYSRGSLKYFDDKKTWLEANRFCIDKGGNLANRTLNNLRSRIPQHRQTAWTGRYLADVWLWMKGCYGEFSEGSAFVNGKSFSRLPDCVGRCMERKGIATSGKHCYCLLQTSNINNRKNQGNMCKIPCSNSSNRVCGGSGTVSVYSFMSANTSVIDTGDIRYCATVNNAGEIRARNCNESVPALCMNGSRYWRGPRSSWGDALKRGCDYQLAVIENGRASQQINGLLTDRNDEAWVGLIREKYLSYVKGQAASNDWVECLLLTKTREEIRPCDTMTSGFICDLPSRVITADIADTDGDQRDTTTGSPTVTITTPTSDIDHSPDSSIVLIVCVAAGVLLFVIVIIACFVRKRKKRQRHPARPMVPVSGPVYSRVNKSSNTRNQRPVHFNDLKRGQDDYDELPKPGEVNRVDKGEEGHYDHTRNLRLDGDYDEIPTAGHRRPGADDTYDHASQSQASTKRANDADDTYDHTSQFQSSMKRANDADNTYDHTSKFKSSTKRLNDADDTHDHTSQFES